LFALNQALKHLKGKKGTIYTDSKYAFGVAHTFGKIWTVQAFINSKAKSWCMGN
jgi:ribonuclease HI